MMDEYAEQLLDAALKYVAQGVAVFPVKLGVRGGNKKDVRPIADWDAASTTDASTVREWFTGRWAGTTIAIDCGKSGIVVADADVSDGKQGPREWGALNPPVTVRVNTPSGGLHDYYREDPEHPVTVDNTGAVADGVDVRGQGGFVFAPPSRDPRGGAWEWADGSAPTTFDAFPIVPRVVTERVAAAQANKRPKQASLAPPRTSLAPEEESSSLFGGGQRLADYGPMGGFKTQSAAVALLAGERDAFLALTEVGSGRSHILSQRFAVLAGHGVGVFWSWEDALDTILKACADNGFTAEHGEAYAQQQAVRGLEYGTREPWVRQEEPAQQIEAAVAAAPADAVEALLAEMISPAEVGSRPAPRYLIKGLLNLDSESWIIGEPGSKKSFVAQDMAGHVARGMPWQGLKVTQARVVMIVAEGAGGMSSRIKAWEQQYGPMGDEVFILPRPVQAREISQWAVLVKACARLMPGLIVLDTQARITVGLEENSATDMGVYVEAVRALREATGACVFTVHHTGRKGGDARGSSAIDGAQHTELKVEVDKSNKLRGRLSVEKQKDMEMRPALPLLFVSKTVGVDEDGDPVTSLVLERADAWSAAEAAGEVLQEAGEPLEEPGAWTAEYVPAYAVIKRRILQAMAQHGQEVGRTESQYRAAVAERWYPGQKRLQEKDWAAAWTSVVGLMVTADGLDDVPLVLRENGKFKINKVVQG